MNTFANDRAPSGFSASPHGHDPSVPYLDTTIVTLRQRAANARHEMAGLPFESDQRRYWTAVASQADNEAAAREKSMKDWNGRALKLRMQAAEQLRTLRAAE